MKFHKNFRLVALFATMMALGAQATPVSPVEVCRAVSAWAAANGSAFANLGVVDTAEAVSENGTNLYWIVRMSNGGAVIASPDTNIDLVIAVLDKFDGSFPQGHPLPAILRRDMLNRLSVIGSQASSGAVVQSSSSTSSQTSAISKNLSEAVKASVGEANAQWEKYSRSSGVSLLADSLADGDNSPYVRRIVDGFESGGRYTHWNQSESPIDYKPLYNMYTPNNAVCGCVATAASAIMQFFGCTNDIGEVAGENCTYNDAPYDCSTLPGALDWSLLPTNGVEAVYDCVATNDAARDLIGRVAYNMGVLVGMMWTDGESGAVTIQLAEVFKKYGFNTARYVNFNAQEKGTAQYFKTVYAQNWAGAPVVLSIHGTVGGHAVVACGYAKDPDGDEFCRVFMGWGGSADAWYKFPKVDDFNMVNSAVTMLGYQDDAVVPVCGWSNVPSTKFSVVNGDSDVIAEASADGSGYFAVRIPMSTVAAGLRIVHQSTEKELEIAPFDGAVIQDETADLATLEPALPDEMLFLGLDMICKTTVASARAKALEEGKALLMVSGSGGERDGLLVDYICHLDSITDISNKFVFVHVNSRAASADADGDPSIGVFNPADGSAELRWWEANGRLTYENFIDYDASTNELVYTFSAEDASALTNSVDFVLGTGYDSFLRVTSGIIVKISSLNAATGDEIVIGDATPSCGTHENCWTNGEIAVLSAPAVYTNDSSGIVYDCYGWTTNAFSDEVSVEPGNSVELYLSTSNSVDFAWLWKESAYRIRASAQSLSGLDIPADAIGFTGESDGAECWRVPGDRVTVVATNAISSHGLYSWSIISDTTGVDMYERIPVVENGRTLSFTVTEPASVTATYRSGTSAAEDPVEVKVAVSVQPEELADLMNGDGVLGLGTNTTYDTMASLVAQSSDIVDSTGGVWKCTGWVVNGVTNAPSGLVELDSGEVTEVELVWELQEPEIVLPEPGDISITSISRADDGKWTVTISGAVKDCWYWLYASDDLSKLAGTADAWTADVAAKRQATEDGEIAFEVTASGSSLFWRARATATETGE